MENREGETLKDRWIQTYRQLYCTCSRSIKCFFLHQRSTPEIREKARLLIPPLAQHPIILSPYRLLSFPWNSLPCSLSLTLCHSPPLLQKSMIFLLFLFVTLFCYSVLDGLKTWLKNIECTLIQRQGRCKRWWNRLHPPQKRAEENIRIGSYCSALRWQCEKW